MSTENIKSALQGKEVTIRCTFSTKKFRINRVSQVENRDVILLEGEREYQYLQAEIAEALAKEGEIQFDRLIMGGVRSISVC